MQLMGAANILIAGMRGLGVEVAHNVILSGVKSVTVQDEGSVLWEDLSSQFFLREADLGQNRAVCSLPRLSSLNPGVQVSAHSGPLHQDMLLQYHVVVLTDSTLEEQKRLGNHCHSHGIRFIVVDTRGLCGQLFCDFGEEFTVLDRNGDMPVTALINDITKGNPGLVTCLDEKKCAFPEDCKVSFSDVCGMTELNTMDPQEIKVISGHSFSIGDTSGFSEYKCGGIATEVKQPITLKFKPLEEALLDHELLVMTDYGKISRHQTLHLAFQGLHTFMKKEQRLPRPTSQSDAAALLDMVRELNASAPLQHLDEDLVGLLARTARGNLAPLNAFMGGIAAQEVLKACSGKFSPLHQWLYFDALECLHKDDDDKEEQLSESTSSSNGSRYDGQIAVFGSKFQERLGKLKYFLVGAGAIGCELLKNFALMGLGAGEGGHITVTDMDSIERSNLNRQFLFRSQDIGRQKSTVAAQAVREMNPHVNITAHQNRLDPDSERIYDGRFFRALDGVVAALDNVEARVYLDTLCVQHQKSMLDGGTLGTKGHTLVVVPHLTESYGPPQSSSDDAIPLCTLKYFPHRIEHTLQWARDQFEGLFKQVPENVNLFLSDANFVERTLSCAEAEALEVLEGVFGSLRASGAGGRRPAHWEDCVHWARCQWESLYRNEIQQLLHHFPPAQLTSSGLPFWSGTKRCPHPLTFDPHKDAHMQYIVAAANLYGTTYGIAGTRDCAAIRETLKNIIMPSCKRMSLSASNMTEEDKDMDCSPAMAATEKARLEELKVELCSPSLKNPAMQMHPVDFEKVSSHTSSAHTAHFTHRRHSGDRTSGGSESCSTVRVPSAVFWGGFTSLGFSVTQICVSPPTDLCEQSVSVCILCSPCFNVKHQEGLFFKVFILLGGK
ncbi:Ubiquitin-like modifier-activating enzyme 1 [Merluccius polli]|uniref:E1 ubiquitin-activating enzyme n=1 Tax=Merluccius polli TaxID=89951 RepID=A0AA47M9E4_MERPO|nr:Ubiquitin-like modifier-activating enzyme 1 [Merluccius polli]